MDASSPAAARSRYAAVSPEMPPPTTQYERPVIRHVRREYARLQPWEGNAAASFLSS
jgi:hypothetical protein